MMNSDYYFDLVDSLSAYWRLERNAAALLAIAYLNTARQLNEWTHAKTVGILYAYHSMGILTDSVFTEATEMLEVVASQKTPQAAIDYMRFHFGED